MEKKNKHNNYEKKKLDNAVTQNTKSSENKQHEVMAHAHRETKLKTRSNQIET